MNAGLEHVLSVILILIFLLSLLLCIIDGTLAENIRGEIRGRKTRSFFFLPKVH